MSVIGHSSVEKAYDYIVSEAGLSALLSRSPRSEQGSTLQSNPVGGCHGKGQLCTMIYSTPPTLHLSCQRLLRASSTVLNGLGMRSGNDGVTSEFIQLRRRG